MNTKIIGLDIGSTSIKFAYLKKDDKTIKLSAVGAVETQGKSIMSESIVDMQNFSDTIKNMLSSINEKVPNVVMSLPENLVYTKIIEMPELSEQELSAALKFEMEQYIPLPLNETRTDWEILEHNDIDGKKTMSIMLVAAPIAILSKYEKLTQAAGLIPEAIETEIVSAHRALLPLISGDDANMIVHIGAATTSVAIVKKGIIKMVVSTALGGAAITRAISLDLGIDASQAENYKKAYGLNKEAFEGKIGKALTPILDSMIGDIRKAMLLYREKSNNDTIKQVILSGGSAMLPGIDVYFTNTLNTQVVLGNAFTAYNIQNVPAEISAQAAAYNVVIGLALRNFL